MTRSEISALLFQHWDPLGVQACAPPDEYDDYAAVLEQMIGSGATTEAIRQYLSGVRATVLMAAPALDADRRIAELLDARREPT